MKNFKFIVVIALLFMFLGVEAQQSKYLAPKDPGGSWYYENLLSAGDTLGSGDSTWYFTVYPNKGERLFYEIQVNLDSVGGTAANIPVILKGRTIGSNTFTNIDTLTWTGSASATNDTTIIFEQKSTAQFYTEYQLYIQGASDSFRVLVDWIRERYWY